MEIKKGVSKKLIVAISIFVVLVAVTVTGLVFAYLNQSIRRDYETVIKATNVTFRFNEMTYLDEVETKDINLFKGASTDVTMKVEVLGSRRVVVEYGIDFTVDLVGADAGNFIPAIEVYRKTDGKGEGKYEFLCMLDQLENLGESAIRGFMVTDYEDIIPLRFVYSSAAGSYYDDLAANGDIAFTIKASASAEVSAESEHYVFASTTDEFKTVFTNADNVGKTILLAGSEPIQVNEALTSAGIIGIDLNGSTLEINNNLIIDCGSNATARLGITNSKPAGGLTVNGGGSVAVTNLKNVYLIGNDIAAGGVISGNVKIGLHLGNYEAVYNDLVALLKERAAALDDGTVYLAGADVSFLFDDIFGYFKTFNLSITGESVIQNRNNPAAADQFYIKNAHNEMTSRFQFVFYAGAAEVLETESGSSTETINLNKIISGYVTVRGSSAKAIADELFAGIPPTITSSQLFKTYDTVTGAHIDWYVDDGMNGRLLSGEGIYRKNGLDSIIGELTAGSSFAFADRTVDIYIKVTKGGDTAGEYGDSGASSGTIMQERGIVTVSAKERTALVFNNMPVTLGEDYTAYSILGEYLNGSYLSVNGLPTAVGLSGIRIVLDETSPAFEKGYVELTTDVTGKYDVIKLIDGVDIPQNTLNNLNFTVTFIYSDGKEYTLPKTIAVSGGLADITKYDMTYTLQSAFIGNEYTEGNGDTFYAYGALRPRVNGISVPVLVDYTVQSPANSYISVTYKFVSVADLGGEFNEQVAYFTYANGTYTYADQPDTSNPTQYYERKAVVQVLQSRVLTVDQITAYLDATLYSLYYEYADTDIDKEHPLNFHLDVSGNKITGTPDRNEGGELIYVDPTSGIVTDPETGIVSRVGKVLKYTVSLEIMGIIRNNADQIADTQLYYVYLQLFDANGDGILTSKEAGDWDGAVARGLPLNLVRNVTYRSSYVIGTYYYIDLSGKTITSLKGIEYFPEVTGYDLSSTNRIDISAFASLPNIVFLRLQSNNITDISALQYSDKLQHLDLYRNKITNVEALRYLPALRYLNIQGSGASYNVISDFEPLTETTSLVYLDIYGLTTVYNAYFTTDAVTMYHFALMKLNCPDLVFYYNTAISADPAALVAAKVMRDLEDINRTQGTLYLPTYYYYENAGGAVTKYRLFWYTDVTETNIVFDYSGGEVVQYSIVSPIQDKPVNIFLKVYRPGEGDESYAISRRFNLTLEASYNYDKAYIFTDAGYQVAEDIVPDANLRTLLFEMFNKDVSTDTMIEVEDGVFVSELYVISAADLSYHAGNTSSLYDFSYRGISSLEGIGYFSSVLFAHLKLNGNNFPSEDLSYLIGLENITTLTLGGAKYDFTDLLNIAPGVDRDYRPARLTALYVTECYGLDDEEVLAGLYEVYCSQASRASNNTQMTTLITIYMPSAWNPYTAILSREVSKLQSTAAFARRGDGFNIYTANGGTSAGIPVTVYNTNPFLTAGYSDIYYYYYNNTGTRVTSGITGTSAYFGYASGEIVYTRSFGHAMAVQMRIALSFVDRRGQSVSFSYYYIQCNVEDGGDYLDVYEDGTGKYLGTFSEVVASHDLKVIALTSIYNYIKTRWSTAYSGNHADSISGLTSANFYIADSSGYSGTFSDYPGRISISTAMFGNTSVVGTTNSLIMNTYSGDYLVKGLKYFTYIKTLTIYSDASFGDGSDLINITSMTIQRASVDLSTIKTTLPNLVTLSITNFFYFNAGYVDEDAGINNSAFVYFPNLTSFSISGRVALYTTANTYYYWLNDLSFLKGLIDYSGEYPTSNLTSLTAYSLSGSSWNSATATAGTSSKNAMAVKELYVASLASGKTNQNYRIGTPTSHTSNYYFRAIYNVPESTDAAKYNDIDNWTAWAASSNSDAEATLTESWEAGKSASTDLNVTAASNLSYLAGGYYAMRELGLKYKTPGDSEEKYWLENKNWNTSTTTGRQVNKYLTPVDSGTILYLPSSTAATYFGFIFGDEATDKIDEDRDFRIVWNVYTVKKGDAANKNGYTTLDVYDLTDTSVYDFDEYATHTVSGDSYVSVIGVITTYGDSSTVLSTRYAYWYEFMVGAGDGIYTYNETTQTGVESDLLRMWLFSNRTTYAGSTGTSMQIMTSSTYILYKYSMYSNMRYVYKGTTYAFTYLPIETSSYLYTSVTSIKGIDDVTNYWLASDGASVSTKITHFYFSNPKFSDLSPVYAFENLTYLELGCYSSSATYYGHIEIDESIEGKLLKLTYLNLTYNYSITPDSMRYFALSARPALATLTLRYTRCMYNYDMVGIMKDIVDGTSGDRIATCSINSSATALTLQQIKDFQEVTGDPTQIYPNGFSTDDTSGLYANQSARFTRTALSGASITFDYAISSAMNTLIKNNLVSNNLPVRLRVTCSTSGYNQFTGTYVDGATFRRSDVTSPYRFGSSGLTADNFDTEFIAYIFSSLTKNAVTGNYEYTSNSALTISSASVKTLAGAALIRSATSSAAISFNSAYSDSYALSYKETTNTVAPTVNITTTAANTAFISPFTNTSYDDYMLNIVAWTRSYTFFGDSQPSYKAQLPNYIYYKGVACKIEWTAAGTVDGTALQPNNWGAYADIDNEQAGYVLYKDTDGYTYLILNKNTVPINTAATHSFYIYHRISGSTITSTTTYYSTTFTFTKRPDTIITNSSYTFIEAEIDDMGTPDTSDDEIIIDSGNGEINKRIGLASAVAHETLYKNASGRYYNYDTTGSDTLVTVVSAAEVFPSSWLVRYMYLTYFNNTANTVLRSNGETYGMVMTYSNINAMTELDVRYGTGASSTSTYPRQATSLIGVDIFQNMTSVILRGGMVNDISPLAGMTLTTFYYDNTRDNNSTVYSGITDFSPLFKNSKDSLQYFTYNAGTSQMVDMSFLLGFTHSNLKIYISSDYSYQYYTYTDGTYYSSYYEYSYNGLSYFMTSSGRTLINLLKEKNIYIYTYNSNSAFSYANSYFGTGRTALAIDTTKSISGTGNGNLPGFTLYALKVSTEDDFAFDAIKGFDNEIDSITYTDGYLMTVDTTASNVSTATTDTKISNTQTETKLNSITFEVTATIVSGSGFYIIDWESANKNTVIGNYYLTRALTITYADDDGVIRSKSYAAGEVLSALDLKLISGSLEYYNAHKTGLTQLVTSVTVYTETLEVTDARAVARIEFNSYAYDRTFNFAFSA